MSQTGWIGVDFDGTLAQYEKWVSTKHAGDPVPAMVRRVKAWLKEGKEVRIFTARIFPLNRLVKPVDQRQLHGTHIENYREEDAWTSVETIRAWCQTHLGTVLPITNVKDYGMIELWDDRCVQVQANTGLTFIEIINKGEEL